MSDNNERISRPKRRQYVMYTEHLVHTFTGRPQLVGGQLEITDVQDYRVQPREDRA
ncbi:hypothetical protein [Mycolicibacterium gilvum]|uniref:hypothetical protein n=1 Tax=Mycolicibacterium gilvum TaxID=1804 RepID=UPI004045AB48